MINSLSTKVSLLFFKNSFGEYLTQSNPSVFKVGLIFEIEKLNFSKSLFLTSMTLRRLQSQSSSGSALIWFLPISNLSNFCYHFYGTINDLSKLLLTFICYNSS